VSESEVPTERKEYVRQRQKRKHSWTDKEMDNLSSKQWRRLDRSGKALDYRLIAEVVEAKHCALKPKKGDKIVFNGVAFVCLEETTFPVLCLWALTPILPFSFMIMDRICEGINPNGMFFDHIKCIDTGAECGGLGEVLFKIYCIEIPPEQRLRIP
jgi:uncharacterized repeat protein (TIGR04076 family)